MGQPLQTFNAGTGSFRTCSTIAPLSSAQLFNYVVTSNQIHLLVKDTRGEVIAHSNQLIARQTALVLDTLRKEGDT
jgi:hypothetical protein